MERKLTAQEVKELTIPFLLDNLQGVLENFQEEEREFMEAVLVAYLTEDEEEYNKLVRKLIKADDGLAKFFDTIDK